MQNIMQKILPPILLSTFILIMAMIHWLADLPHNIQSPYNKFGYVLILAGLYLAFNGSRLFSNINTNIHTFNEPDKLVTEGIFSLSRNPMYLGFAICIIGFAIIFHGTLFSWLIAITFIAITNFWYIAFEEKIMLEKFGEDYKDYCTKVRRWI